MKKTIISSAVAAATAVGTLAQTGRFEVIDAGSFRVHVYYSNDAMGDASYIVEGKDGLVFMEMPLFKVGDAEFLSYAEALGKPVEGVISDYHLGGSGDAVLVMPEGMPAFMRGPIYGGMMDGFKRNWGESMVALPQAETKEVPFGRETRIAGIKFLFTHGASSDFPAASIVIGDKVFYTHWAPAKAHVSPLQVSSRAAIDAEIVATEAELASGCDYYIGGHGGEAPRDAVEFKLSYLRQLKSLVESTSSADSLVESIKAAYPGLAGEENLQGLAAALFK